VTCFSVSKCFHFNKLIMPFSLSKEPQTDPPMELYSKSASGPSSDRMSAAKAFGMAALDALALPSRCQKPLDMV